MGDQVDLGKAWFCVVPVREGTNGHRIGEQRSRLRGREAMQMVSLPLGP